MHHGILYASIFINLSHSHSSFDADTIKVYERSSVPSNTDRKSVV